MPSALVSIRRFTLVATIVVALPAVSAAQSPTRPAQQIDTVRVTAPADPSRKSYFITAKEIDSSGRYVADALDVVMKLRPDMAWGRVGRPDEIELHGWRTVAPSSGKAALRYQPPGAPASASQLVQQGLKYGYCPPVQNLWVNGEWIRDIAVNDIVVARLTRTTAITTTIATALASIRPEHIAEMEFHACNDKVADSTAHSTNAIYVKLKPGIRFIPGAGSTSGPVMVAVNSNRLLGVYDDVTGDALSDVEVVDLATGTVARTTKTGTIGLGFLGDGRHDVRIRKPGFASQTLTVNAASDSTPITLILTHAPR